MFVVVNELFVTPENRAKFERNFPASMRGTLSGVPGLRAARLLHPAQSEQGYLSILEFTDDAAYAASVHPMRSVPRTPGLTMHPSRATGSRLTSCTPKYPSTELPDGADPAKSGGVIPATPARACRIRRR
jgi:hypothetical protein